MNEQTFDLAKDNIYMKDVLINIIVIITYLKKRWRVLLLVSFIGGLLGVFISLFQQPKYSAVCTFVLDDPSNNGSGLSQYAGLAGLAGITLGGNGGGIFEGDNIIELYKSRTMIEKALLTEIIISGKKQRLIDRFIDSNGLRTKWKRKGEDASINFDGDPKRFTRKQDSIISNLTKLFNEKILVVTKPDKKLNIINVNVVSNDESFSMEFTNKLVETVNKFYLETKTKKNFQNVQILQHQADSIKKILNISISGVASAVDATPNANSAMTALRVPSQRKQVDVQSSASIYSEIVKNLELGKITLRQESPLIQVIDVPTLPLELIKPNKFFFALVGFLISSILCIICIFLKKQYSEVLKD